MAVPRAVTFDVGGTLLSPFPSVGEIYAEVLMQCGVRADAVALNAGFRKAWDGAHRTPRVGLTEESERHWWRGVVRTTLTGVCEVGKFELVFQRLWDTFAETGRWKLRDGTMKMLHDLKTRGIRLGILSNWDSRLPKLLQGFGIAPLMEHMVVSSQVGFEKPDPRIFELCLQRFGLQPGQMLHVGDSVFHDLEPAARLGWQVWKVERDADFRGFEWIWEGSVRR